jgi:hypothetical protein
LWVYLGDAAHPYNVFDFTVNRKRDGPQQLLTNYQGYLHADAFSGYDGLYLPDPSTAAARILEVACNVHARRTILQASSTVACHLPGENNLCRGRRTCPGGTAWSYPQPFGPVRGTNHDREDHQ